MQYFAASLFNLNQCRIHVLLLKVISIAFFFLFPIIGFPRAIPVELMECEALHLNHQSELALACLNDKRPQRLTVNSCLSVIWLELWLEAKLGHIQQGGAIKSKLSQEHINLAIKWLASPDIEQISKQRLSQLVYQHINQKSPSISASVTAVMGKPNKNQFLFAFMILLSVCIIGALLILNRYDQQVKNYFNAPEQTQKVLYHHVKERNQALIQHYSQLQDYSIANSHLVRAPLARLLGLVELLKEEPLTRDGKFYLQHIAQSCEELDEWVLKMNTILDTETEVSKASEEVSSLSHFLSKEK